MSPFMLRPANSGRCELVRMVLNSLLKLCSLLFTNVFAFAKC